MFEQLVEAPSTHIFHNKRRACGCVSLPGGFAFDFASQGFPVNFMSECCRPSLPPGSVGAQSRRKRTVRHVNTSHRADEEVKQTGITIKCSEGKKTEKRQLS